MIEKAGQLLPSQLGEFHPEPLTDPDVNLSIHPARATARRLPPSAETSGSSRFDPVGPQFSLQFSVVDIGDAWRPQGRDTPLRSTDPSALACTKMARHQLWLPLRVPTLAPSIIVRSIREDSQHGTLYR